MGYRITEEALCFGGAVCTATDIAVRLGMTELGDREKVMSLDEGFARKALAAITTLAEDALDAMKVSAGDVDVILVGGGSIILPEKLSGARSVAKPAEGGVANAIGSAISKVSGTCEKLVDYNEFPGSRPWSSSRPRPWSWRCRPAQSGRPWRSSTWRTYPCSTTPAIPAG